MPAYILTLSHGDYDDHVEIPVAVVHDSDSATLLASALESRERQYVDKVPVVRKWIELDAGDFSIDICAVPIVEV